MVYKRYVYLETKITQSSKTKILKALPYRTRRNRIVNIDNDTTIIYELKYYVESSNKNEFLNDLKRITEITNLSIEFNLDNKCYLLVKNKEGVVRLPKLKESNKKELYVINEKKVDKYGVENLFNSLVKNQDYLRVFNDGYYNDFSNIEEENLRIKMSLVKFLKEFYRKEMEQNEEKEQTYYFYQLENSYLKNIGIIKNYNEEQFNYYIKGFLYGNNYNKFCLNLRPIDLEILLDLVKDFFN